MSRAPRDTRLASSHGEISEGDDVPTKKTGKPGSKNNKRLDVRQKKWRILKELNANFTGNESLDEVIDWFLKLDRASDDELTYAQRVEKITAIWGGAFGDRVMLRNLEARGREAVELDFSSDDESESDVDNHVIAVPVVATPAVVAAVPQIVNVAAPVQAVVVDANEAVKNRNLEQELDCVLHPRFGRAHGPMPRDFLKRIFGRQYETVTEGLRHPDDPESEIDFKDFSDWTYDLAYPEGESYTLDGEDRDLVVDYVHFLKRRRMEERTQKIFERIPGQDVEIACCGSLDRALGWICGFFSQGPVVIPPLDLPNGLTETIVYGEQGGILLPTQKLLPVHRDGDITTRYVRFAQWVRICDFMTNRSAASWAIFSLAAVLGVTLAHIPLAFLIAHHTAIVVLTDLLRTFNTLSFGCFLAGHLIKMRLMPAITSLDMDPSDFWQYCLNGYDQYVTVSVTDEKRAVGLDERTMSAQLEKRRFEPYYTYTTVLRVKHRPSAWWNNTEVLRVVTRAVSEKLMIENALLYPSTRKAMEPYITASLTGITTDRNVLIDGKHKSKLNPVPYATALLKSYTALNMVLMPGEVNPSGGSSAS